MRLLCMCVLCICGHDKECVGRCNCAGETVWVGVRERELVLKLSSGQHPRPSLWGSAASPVHPTEITDTDKHKYRPSQHTLSQRWASQRSHYAAFHHMLCSFMARKVRNASWDCWSLFAFWSSGRNGDATWGNWFENTHRALSLH